MAKTPRILIRESQKEIAKLMQEYLVEISADIIADIISNAKSGNKSQATKNIKTPNGQWYKIDLKEAVAVVVREAINNAKEEVPARIKFAEYEDLPAAIRRFVDAQVVLYASTQVEDLKKKIAFKYQDTLSYTDNIEEIKKAMAVEAAIYAESAAISAGASKLVSTAVNSARKAYFDQPEVMEKIEAFQYVNPEPNAAICVSLQNHVFRADDPELQRWTPPFHFNCDGYLRPILVGNLKGRVPSEYVPTKKALESVQFSEKSDKDILLKCCH